MWKYSYDLEPNVESRIEPPSSYGLDNISTLLGCLMFNSSFQVFKLSILVNSDAFEFHQFQVTNNQQCQISQSCTISQSTPNPKSKQFPSSIKCFIYKKNNKNNLQGHLHFEVEENTYPPRLHSCILQALESDHLLLHQNSQQ